MNNLNNPPNDDLWVTGKETENSLPSKGVLAQIQEKLPPAYKTLTVDQIKEAMEDYLNRKYPTPAKRESTIEVYKHDGLEAWTFNTPGRIVSTGKGGAIMILDSLVKEGVTELKGKYNSIPGTFIINPTNRSIKFTAENNL